MKRKRIPQNGMFTSMHFETRTAIGVGLSIFGMPFVQGSPLLDSVWSKTKLCYNLKL
jgi:hypothetical protein